MLFDILELRIFYVVSNELKVDKETFLNREFAVL